MINAVYGHFYALIPQVQYSLKDIVLLRPTSSIFLYDICSCPLSLFSPCQELRLSMELRPCRWQ